MFSSSLLTWRRVATSDVFTPPDGRGLHSVGDCDAGDDGGGGVGASPRRAPGPIEGASPRLADARFATRCAHSSVGRCPAGGSRADVHGATEPSGPCLASSDGVSV